MQTNTYKRGILQLDSYPRRAEFQENKPKAVKQESKQPTNHPTNFLNTEVEEKISIALFVNNTF